MQEVQDNRSALQKLEELIENSKSNNNSHYDNRDLNDVEKAKIEEWKNEIDEQDKELDEIHKGVKMLKNEVRIAGEGIDNVGLKDGKDCSFLNFCLSLCSSKSLYNLINTSSITFSLPFCISFIIDLLL